MELFSISEQWMEAFGKTLIHSIWVGLVLVGLLKLLFYSISHKHSQLRYTLSLSALLLYAGSVTAFFIALYQPSGTTPGMNQPSEVFTPASWLLHLSETGGPSYDGSIWTLCSFLYGLGVVIMLIRVAFASFNLYRVKVSGTPAQEPWATHFLQLASKLGIQRKVRLLVSEKMKIPGLIGWVRPVVIVPAGMLTHLPVNQLDTILMHELYHLKRYDFLINAIQMILEGVVTTRNVDGSVNVSPMGPVVVMISGHSSIDTAETPTPSVCP